MRLHHRKGSLLEYNGVYLAEGPWPGKAYFDALRRARQRDASLYLDYGFTRPRVISRGPMAQMSGTPTGGVYDGPVVGAPAAEPTPPPPPIDAAPLGTAPMEETIPPPSSEPLSMAPPSGVTPVAYAEALPAPAPLAAPAVARPLAEAPGGVPQPLPAVPPNPFTRAVTVPTTPPTPLQPLPAHESQANYPAAEAPANPTGW
jgi:hypothetical protein